jgi:hypothetical protein
VQELLESKCAVIILDQLQHQREHAQTLSHVKMVSKDMSITVPYDHLQYATTSGMRPPVHTTTSRHKQRSVVSLVLIGKTILCDVMTFFCMSVG